jgi:hypothetical protein
MTVPPFASNKSLTFLSGLLFEQDPRILSISRDEFEDALSLANSHHVVIRSLEVLRQIAGDARDEVRGEWATGAMVLERARIENALSFLREICDTLQSAGHDVTVIKSLDHWPDLGSDLDLYTNARAEDVIRLMKQRFNAQIAARSWGDRLANKWNFIVLGLHEPVEVHVGRLGQTGEQVAIANSLPARARSARVGDRVFRVPAAEDRLMIATLQRMYRHFYFRLCDIVDTAMLLETDTVDYDDLCSSAQAVGIWEGVATYLSIVSDYVKHYRGKGLDLPYLVSRTARFGGDQLHFARGFLRVPILPHSARLYASQLTTLLLNRELKNTARLSLLPCLATAAAVGQKITGSDKGIW